MRKALKKFPETDRPVKTGTMLIRMLSRTTFSRLTSVKSRGMTMTLNKRSLCSSSSDPTDSSDVVIVGGGMVGSSLAAGLASDPVFKDKRILLLEGALEKRFVPPEKGTGFSNRVSALNPATVTFLSKIGAWQHVLDMDRCHGFTRMFVWDECSPANIEFNSSSDDVTGTESVLGHMVENDVTVEALTRVMKDLPNLQVVYGAKIEGCVTSEGQRPAVRLQDGREIKAAGLLVGADGANSVVRKAMKGRHYFSKDYHQMGVVGTLTFDREFDNDTAYQKFMKTGPIAILPLSSNKSSLVWTVPKEWSKPMTSSMTSQEFVAKLNEALNTSSSSPLIEGANVMLGSIIRNFNMNSRITKPVKPPPIASVDNLAAFPLGSGLPERAASKEGTVLCGDAFHRIHPLAGQGVNLGFGDAEALVQALSEGVRMGRALGEYATLCNYETRRMRHNLPMMAAVDSLQKLYCTDNPFFVLARSLGLQVVNSNSTLKSLALNQASN